MTPSELVSRLFERGIRVVRPGVGRVKLIAHTGDVPQSALDLAKPLKKELLAYLSSQRCNCGQLMIPYGLDVAGWRNWDCPVCKAVKPLREVAS